VVEKGKVKKRRLGEGRKEERRAGKGLQKEKLGEGGKKQDADLGRKSMKSLAPRLDVGRNSSPVLMDLTSELFGSESEGSVVVLSDDSSLGGADSDHSLVGVVQSDNSPMAEMSFDLSPVDFDHSPIGLDASGAQSEDETRWLPDDLDVGVELPHPPTPPTCMVLSSDDEDDIITECSGVSFEDALSGKEPKARPKRQSEPRRRAGGVVRAWNSKAKVNILDLGVESSHRSAGGSKLSSQPSAVVNSDLSSRTPSVVKSDLSSRTHASTAAARGGVVGPGVGRGVTSVYDYAMQHDILFRKTPSLKLLRARLNRVSGESPSEHGDVTGATASTPARRVAGILRELGGSGFTPNTSDDESSGDSVLDGNSSSTWQPHGKAEVRKPPSPSDTLRKDDVFLPAKAQKTTTSWMKGKAALVSDPAPASPTQEQGRERAPSSSSDRSRRASLLESFAGAEPEPLGQRTRASSTSSTHSVEAPVLTTVGTGSTAKVLMDVAKDGDSVHEPCGPYISLSRIALQQKKLTAAIHKTSLQKAKTSLLRKPAGHTPTGHTSPSKSQHRSSTKGVKPIKPSSAHVSATKVNCAVLKKKALPPLTCESLH
jgi:hypothetical protein